MGRKVTKKGTTGNVRNFITRTQAVKKLQISLPDFRRLCIFKGIYPREPRSRKKASKSASHSTTFYYTRDIQYLLHEPLINKFRDHKALAKKIGRALGRGEVKDAQRMHRTLTPKITLDHIIKDRYPTFIDALRDLDDCLSMLFLFANLPSTTHVSPKTIAACQRLCLEFQHYLIVSHSLRKSFLSIKGIYYQATIQGQDILWLVPYKFVQRTAGDIDFRIMGTFIEFYITLLGFVNFRLYTSAGLVYPPKFNASSDEKGAELGAYSLEGRTLDSRHQEEGEMATNGHVDKIAQAAAQAEANKIAQLTVTEEEGDFGAKPPVTAEDEPTSTAIDTFEVTGDDADTLLQPEKTAEIAPTLFAPFTFYLSRETPRQPLEFILKAFGCKRVGWDTVLGEGAFTSDELDPNITHQVVDRPPLAADAVNGVDEASQENVKVRQGGRVPGRIYVQPQWVWDCVNQGRLLRPDLYGPGATLPPHLSPWTKPKKGQYDPTAPLAEQEREGEAEQAELEAAAAEEAEEADLEAAAEEAEEEGDVDEEDEDDEDEDDEELEKVVNGRDSLLDRLGDGEAGEGMDVALGNDKEIEEDGDAPEDDDWSGFGDDEAPELDDAAAEALQHQRELEAEAMGLPLPTAAAPTKKSQLQDAKKKAAKKRRQEEEELERQKMMLSKKKRKMVEGIMARNEKADTEAQKLREKRRKLEMKL